MCGQPNNSHQGFLAGPSTMPGAARATAAGVIAGMQAVAPTSYRVTCRAHRTNVGCHAAASRAQISWVGIRPGIQFDIDSGLWASHLLQGDVQGPQHPGGSPDSSHQGAHLQGGQLPASFRMKRPEEGQEAPPPIPTANLGIAVLAGKLWTGHTGACRSAGTRADRHALEWLLHH